jgi:hypothetical protein
VILARLILPLLLVSGGVCHAAQTLEGIHNGSFEEGLSEDGARPRWWLPEVDPPSAPMASGWSLFNDPERGSVVLQLSPTGGINAIAMVASQAADLPAATMAGVRVTFSVAMANRGGGQAVAGLFAVDPELPPDPTWGVGLAGYCALSPQGADWATKTCSFDLDGNAAYLAVVLWASGPSGLALFDDVSVRADLPMPGCRFDPEGLAPLEGGPPAFPIGLVNENPRNTSEYAAWALPGEAEELAGAMNLFFHIRWNALAGKPLLDGHERLLEIAREARRRGMDLMISYAFTHASLEHIADLAPLPDGTPVGRLDDPAVADAFGRDLEAIVEETCPDFLSVGIETDFFHDAHPDQWPAFRSLLCRAHDELPAVAPGLHVTTYFMLPTLVNADASLNSKGAAALRALLPCIDSVGYSTYPASDGRRLDDYPPGFFSAASLAAPELPLIVPECGFRGDTTYPEIEQEAFLRRLLKELASHGAVLAALYSMHDQHYFGAPDFFQEAFDTIGLHFLDGTPKRLAALLRGIRMEGAHARPAGSPKALACVARLPCDKGLEDRTDAHRPESVAADWGPPRRLKAPVNSPCPEDAIEISADGKTLYYLYAKDLMENLPPDEVFAWPAGTHAARRLGEADSFVVERFFDLGKGTDASLDGEPTFSPDGRWVYFHSTRADNQGYQQDPPVEDFLDIYRAELTDGEPGIGQNLGPGVNSIYADGEQALHPDGRTLYFASTRPGGLGGNDIWMTRLDGEVWTSPVNLGAPINSASSDTQPTFTSDGSTLYFVSDRNPTVGLAIYRSHLTGQTWSSPELVIKGVVGEPSLTADGRYLYFVHVAMDAHGKFDADIWVSERVGGQHHRQ